MEEELKPGDYVIYDAVHWRAPAKILLITKKGRYRIEMLKKDGKRSKSTVVGSSLTRLEDYKEGK